MIRSKLPVMLFALVASVSLGAPATLSEVKPVASVPCFPGAYYRKAVSSTDHWSGISATVKLPQPDYDMKRVNAKGQPLDNASVYLGGRSNGQEIDCGVSWEVIKESDGSVSKQRKAFRPFWRNKKWYSGPAEPRYYYQPGDVIRMKVENTKDGKLLMSIDLLARADDAAAKLEPKTSVEETTAIVATQPARTNSDDNLTTSPVDAISSFVTVFDAPLFRLEEVKEFKRVNGLDQSGNEGKAVKASDTKITGAVWSEVWLLRGTQRVPMTPERYTDMRCPNDAHVQVKPFGLSGEIVTLNGNPDK